MRKMFSENQIKNIVNEGIESGEIEAGGLTPEQEAKVNNSLQLPESAPAAQQLVGVNTSGVQNSLGIGEGLVIDSNNVSLKRLVLDFNGTTTYQLTEAIATKINNKDYDEIIILNYKNTIDKSKLVFTLNSDVTAAFNGLMNTLYTPTGYNRYHLNGSYIMPNTASNTSSDFYESSTGIHKIFVSYEIYLDINSSFILSLKYEAKSNLDNIYYTLRKTLVLNSTTQSGTFDYPCWSNVLESFSGFSNPKSLFDICIPLVDNIDSSTPYNIYMRFASSSTVTGNKYAYAYGERVDDSGITYKYIMKIDGIKNYTITRIAA